MIYDVIYFAYFMQRSNQDYLILSKDHPGRNICLFCQALLACLLCRSFIRSTRSVL